jgi:hypothetical protein
MSEEQKPAGRRMDSDVLNQWMTELKKEFAPLPQPSRNVAASMPSGVITKKTASTSDPLEQQLGLLKKMVQNQDRKDYRLNFEYITQRSLHLMKNGRFDDFGDVKLFASLEDRAEAIAARWH